MADSDHPSKEPAVGPAAGGGTGAQGGGGLGTWPGAQSGSGGRVIAARPALQRDAPGHKGGGPRTLGSDRDCASHPKLRGFANGRLPRGLTCEHGLFHEGSWGHTFHSPSSLTTVPGSLH